MSDSVEKLRLADRAEAILRKDRSALKKGAHQTPTVHPIPTVANRPTSPDA